MTNQKPTTTRRSFLTAIPPAIVFASVGASAALAQPETVKLTEADIVAAFATALAALKATAPEGTKGVGFMCLGDDDWCASALSDKTTDDRSVWLIRASNPQWLHIRDGKVVS